jgi:hypothetical protein
MLGHIKLGDADGERQTRLQKQRIYQDLDRSLHAACTPRPKPLGEMQPALRTAGKIPNIAIVGAGISGLRCAHVLIDSGAKVTIFEARDRIGGRVCEDALCEDIPGADPLLGTSDQIWRSPDGYVSCHGQPPTPLGTDSTRGANWIHGSENNPITEIARRTGTVTHDFGERRAVFDSKGKRLDDDLATEMSDTVWATIVKAFQFSDENCAEIPASKSLLDFFREEIPKIEKDPIKQALILEEAHMWGFFVGDSIESQSLKFMFLEECIDGGEFVF